MGELIDHSISRNKKSTIDVIHSNVLRIVRVCYSSPWNAYAIKKDSKTTCDRDAMQNLCDLNLFLDATHLVDEKF